MPERDPHARARQALRKCRRVIVKIGSSALASATDTAAEDIFARTAADICEMQNDPPTRRASRRTGKGSRKGPRKQSGAQHREVVLVSSGAIALGVQRLGLSRRPRDMPGLQAAAAAGQSSLMRRYGDAFRPHGVTVAQVLLTHADLASRTRANNGRAALLKLLGLGLLPIINENDAVAVDEIRFGDNDELAAMVVPLCDADALILLTNVDGVLDRQGRRVPFAAAVDDELLAMATGRTSREGSGGMVSKLQAAGSAALAGAQVCIASAATPQVISRIMRGQDVGTLIAPVATKLRPRKHWIAYTLRPRGVAVVDDGAARAITEQGRSILCVGVAGIRGDFVCGDCISVLTLTGREIARGLSKLSAGDAARLASLSTDASPVLIHRDDLVVMPARR